ncbi:MAG: YebC/PmpR family DNA-binding transcriptional regulator [bacterium]|nr:YebC/PmpR family DNA-binding transcriptional regulator [bacterium]
MAGHSRWAQVKHKKAGTDAKRGARFSKLARLITVAAREGGPEPSSNARLRSAVEHARDAGVPKENIARAVARAAGGGEDAALVEREYEAYGPGGSAFLIRAVTDNPNRTTAEVKAILAASDGKFAALGSVAWLFERRAIVSFTLPGPGRLEAETLALIDAGAADIEVGADRLLAIVAPESLDTFERAAAAAGLRPTHTGITQVPTSAVSPDGAARAKAEALADTLEDHPDIVDITTNIQPQ